MDNGRGNAVAADESPGAEPDAEVSFVTRDLAGALPRVKIAAAAPLDEVIARVRDASEWSGNAARPIIAPDTPGRSRLGYAAEGEIDPYLGFEARIVPENITLLPKSAAQANGPNAWNERLVVVKKGESASTILRDLGASPEDIRGLTGVLGVRGRDGGLREGQKLRVLFAPDGGRLRVVRVIVVGDAAAEAVVALSDTGRYVAVDVQSLGGGSTEVAEADEDDENDTTAVRLYQSVYETALRNQIPRPVIDDLVRIYSYDVDFQRKAQPGDSFEVLYSGEEEADARNDVLFAALTVGGETKKFYPLSLARRRRGRLLRRDRQEREEVPGAQAGRRRHHALRLRFPPPSDPRLFQDAHRRRLVGTLRHADLRLGQRHGGARRLGRRLRQIRAREAQQRLRDRLRPHVGIRARHRAGQARAPGTGDRLRRLDRPLDRRACALRDRGQRPLRRSDAHPAAARPRARRPGPRGLREGTRAPRRDDDPQARHARKGGATAGN